ncbi:hypothetical protein [Limnoraphis robusta]|uniref:Uncharacterized protein n=1 Tax=Limnoraphis robusta CCNP1315 TaxID=3110306 RepID=A0ABU5TT10_9CYAN|nr:hypothetical protein [Limnoraphis robusta]MEA5517776.1 hypothetical protein [Limnoraphis robusta CCNP1315]MEA5546418.1 hypothetical protein [Limnoraphis robusta CCNP1324]
MKFLTTILLLLLFLLTFPQASQASMCRTVNENRICILSIKRSAKYHWEYRASVSINGKQKPMEIYNCRRQTKIDGEGKTKRFEKNGAGELICSWLEKS